jgi:putative transposase
LKFHVSYPGRFKSIAESREWFAGFVHNDNTAHSHSGLNFITSFQVRNGNYKLIIKKRNKVMVQAQIENPLRWSNHVKQLSETHVVYLNPSADTRIKIKAKKERKIAS